MSRFFRTMNARGHLLDLGRRNFSTQVTVLPNRVRVVSEPTNARTAVVGVAIDGGSSAENPSTNGSANFLEHLLYQGNYQRFENIGALLNSRVSREQTLLTVQSQPRDLAQSVELLGASLQNLGKFSDQDLESVRNNILHETPSIRDFIFNNLHANAFQESSLGLSVRGPPENIKSLSRQNLLDYVKNVYTAENISVVGSGAIKHEELVRLAERSFASLPTGGKSALLPSTPYMGSMVTIQDDDRKELIVALALKAPSINHPDRLAFSLLRTVFGAFSQNVNGGRAVAPYYARTTSESNATQNYETFYFPYHNTGLFGIFGSINAEEPMDYCWGFLDHMNFLANRLPEAQLERAKSLEKAYLAKREEDAVTVAEELAQLRLRVGQTRRSFKEVAKDIDELTVSSVRELLANYVVDSEPAVSAFGHVGTLPDYSFIRNWTTWRRL